MGAFVLSRPADRTDVFISHVRTQPADWIEVMGTMTGYEFSSHAMFSQVIHEAGSFRPFNAWIENFCTPNIGFLGMVEPICWMDELLDKSDRFIAMFFWHYPRSYVRVFEWGLFLLSRRWRSIWVASRNAFTPVMVNLYRDALLDLRKGYPRLNCEYEPLRNVLDKVVESHFTSTQSFFGFCQV